jgi:DNA-binding NarL/FixJ family response regulator
MKLILVDDHDILRKGLKVILSQLQFAEIIGEARNGKEFLQLMETLQPDIVLMDIAMPEMDGIEATKTILKIQPDLKIIALTMFGDEEYYFKMIHAGARGFVLKESDLDELQEAITTVMEGESFFSKELLRSLIVNISDNKFRKDIDTNPTNLTKREIEILQQICKGNSNNEIADIMSISPKTVETHRNHLLSKTNSKNTVALVMYAIINKLIIV